MVYNSETAQTNKILTFQKEKEKDQININLRVFTRKILKKLLFRVSSMEKQ